MTDLIKIALEGKHTPFDFFIAARHVPGYEPKDYPFLENQMFDTRGRPIADGEG